MCFNVELKLAIVAIQVYIPTIVFNHHGYTSSQKSYNNVFLIVGSTT